MYSCLPSTEDKTIKQTTTTKTQHLYHDFSIMFSVTTFCQKKKRKKERKEKQQQQTTTTTALQKHLLPAKNFPTVLPRKVGLPFGGAEAKVDDGKLNPFNDKYRAKCHSISWRKPEEWTY